MPHAGIIRPKQFFLCKLDDCHSDFKAFWELMKQDVMMLWHSAMLWIFVGK